jgi:hypothetical protein
MSDDLEQSLEHPGALSNLPHDNEDDFGDFAEEPSDLEMTGPVCGGDGMDDDVTPCPHCDGEGSQWWLP